MKSTLLKNALVLVTMDETRREISNGSVLVKGNRIASVGTSSDHPYADEVIDMTGHVVMPGHLR